MAADKGLEVKVGVALTKLPDLEQDTEVTWVRAVHEIEEGRVTSDGKVNHI